MAKPGRKTVWQMIGSCYSKLPDVQSPESWQALANTGRFEDLKFPNGHSLEAPVARRQPWRV